jgi:hypothetical protein
MVNRFLTVALMTTLFLTAAGVRPAAATNIVFNGGFETGNFTGWTLTGNTAFGTGVCLNGNTFLGSTCTVSSGNYAAVSGPSVISGFVSQALATVAGTSYNLTFFLRNDSLGAAPSNAFSVSWGGGVVYSQSNVADQPLTQVVLPNLIASSASTQLSFEFLNNPGGFFVDDVAVDGRAIPEPSTLLLIGVGLAGFAARRRATAGNL